MTVDQTSLQTKYNELSDAYREKSRKHSQTQQLYDALKKKFLVRDAQSAASASVNQTLQSLDTTSRHAMYQQPTPLDPLGVYKAGIGNQRASSDQNQPNGQPSNPSEVSDRGRSHAAMAPPGHTLRDCRCSAPSRFLLTTPAHFGGTNTPMNRTSLPTSRATANRSQLRASTSLQDVRAMHPSLSYGIGSSLRHQLPPDELISRHSGSPSRGFGGITTGMKVGTARMAGNGQKRIHITHYDRH